MFYGSSGLQAIQKLFDYYAVNPFMLAQRAGFKVLFFSNQQTTELPPITGAVAMAERSILINQDRSLAKQRLVCLKLLHHIMLGDGKDKFFKS